MLWNVLFTQQCHCHVIATAGCCGCGTARIHIRGPCMWKYGVWSKYYSVWKHQNRLVMSSLAQLANQSCVSYVRGGFEEHRCSRCMFWSYHTNHSTNQSALFPWLVRRLSSGVQRQFCIRPLTPVIEMKRLHKCTRLILRFELSYSGRTMGGYDRNWCKLNIS